MGDVGSVRVAGRGGCAIRVENKARISSGDESESKGELESKVLRSNLTKSIRPKELSGLFAFASWREAQARSHGSRAQGCAAIAAVAPKLGGKRPHDHEDDSDRGEAKWLAES